MIIHAHSAPAASASPASMLLQPWFIFLVLASSIERLSGIALGVAMDRDWIVLVLLFLTSFFQYIWFSVRFAIKQHKGTVIEFLIKADDLSADSVCGYFKFIVTNISLNGICSKKWLANRMSSPYRMFHFVGQHYLEIFVFLMWNVMLSLVSRCRGAVNLCGFYSRLIPWAVLGSSCSLFRWFPLSL